MSPRSKLISAVAGGLAIIFLFAAYFIGGGRGKPAAEPSASPAKIIKANFQVIDLQTVDPMNRPEASAKAREASTGIISLINSYHDIAFIDKTKWAAGTHPALASLFVPEAQQSVGPTANLGSLSLAELAPKIKAVKPSSEKVSRLSILISPDLSVGSAIASTVFEAQASTTEKKAGPAKIVFEATFWLAPDPAGYKIVAYSTNLKADTITKGSAFGTIPEYLR